jgi:gamma-glutamylcyclotransferase (GGCT)/AIG2-like uncharacterized protein YtfP
MTFVFVYGSLKRGGPNHKVLANSQFVAEAHTRSSLYQMLSLGDYPGVVRGGSSRISGEVYQVTDRILRRLDELEGNGHFYHRIPVLVDGVFKPVEMYILDTSFAELGKPDPNRIARDPTSNALSWVV